METLATGSGKRLHTRWVVLLSMLILPVIATAGIVFLLGLPMSAFLLAISTWLHAIATIIMIGHFLFISLIYLPVLERQTQPDALPDLLEQVSTRLRPFFGSALLIFLITGTHLMVINGNYLGLGQFFGNPWSVLMVIKHGLVVVFLALAVLSERTFLRQLKQPRPGALKHFGWALNTNMVLGLIILLLTSIAQTAIA